MGSENEQEGWNEKEGRKGKKQMTWIWTVMMLDGSFTNTGCVKDLYIANEL